jgi:hypothetical protein
MLCFVLRSGDGNYLLALLGEFQRVYCLMMFFLWVITNIALNGKEICLIVFFMSIIHFCVFTWSNRIEQRMTL